MTAIMTVKEFGKSVNIWQMSNSRVTTFLTHGVAVITA